jgi:hypothetical protein
MKLREVLSLFAVVAMLVPAAVASGAPFGGFAQNDSPDVTEVRHYVLTLEKAQKAANAMQSINQLTASNAALKAKMDAATSGQLPITQQAAYIDANFPQVTSIVHANGLVTREFIVLTGAIINDVGFVGMKMQGMIKAYPAGVITPENAALIEKNWPAFQALAAKMSPPSSR